MTMSMTEATAALTAPGQMFEIGEETIRGIPTRVWKNAPPTLRSVLELSRGHGDKAFLVYAGLWWEPLRGDLDAYMDHVNELVTGTIAVKLYKGHARVVTRSSPNAVYDASLASFAESGGLFSQAAAPGFIELFSLQSRMAWRLRNE